MSKIFRKIISIMSVGILVCGISATGKVAMAKDSVKNIKLSSKGKNAYMDFSVNLLKNNLSTDKNVLISPLSVSSALGMTANGAKKDTLLGMEKALGGNIKDLNNFFKNYRDMAVNNKSISVANSIWIKDIKGLSVNDDFIKKNKEIYSVSVYKEKFDSKTKNKINKWVNINTKGMIKEIVKGIKPDSLMYLINALSFDDEWRDKYSKASIEKVDFTNYKGKKKSVDMMYSSEWTYLSGNDAKGFIKPYKSGYALACVMPDKDIIKYINSLNGKKLAKLLKNQEVVKVNAGLPMFKSETDVTLNASLKKMGMIQAFDANKADFSGMFKSDTNVCINEVLHKTFIEVNSAGTKAGAVTSIEMKETALQPVEPKEVVLNKPFLYMIIDTENNLPVFMGVMLDI